MLESVYDFSGESELNVRQYMKTIAFVIGFLTVMAIAAPRIDATDPEPMGAEASLYLFGFLLMVICAPVFHFSVARRSVPCGWFVALCVGLLFSSIFYSAAASASPALSLARLCFLNQLN